MFCHLFLCPFFRKQYQNIKDEWCGVPEVFDRPDVLEVTFTDLMPIASNAQSHIQERHRIDVDCRRTDRSQPLFSTPPTTSSSTPTPGEDDDEKERAKRYSTISPNMNDIGAQSPSNEHIDRLAAILLTYNFYEKELGVFSFSLRKGTIMLTNFYRVRARDVGPLCAGICSDGC